jgi:MFS transporter, UMF1 family
MLVVAVSSPLLGAIADFSGSKKRFLLAFSVMTWVFTGLLFTVGPGDIFTGMLFFILAEIGYRGGQVFYNSLLPEIAEPEDMGRVSGMGWAVGSLGGIVCLLIILPLIVTIEGPMIVRLSLIITAVFFLLSSLPIFIWLRERGEPERLPPGQNYLTIGFQRLGRTFRTVRHYREFIKFVVAFLIYNDGIITVMNFGAIIGAVLFGMDQQTLIIFIIVIQVTNAIGAWVFGMLVDKIGGKQSLVLSLLMMIGVIVWLYFSRTMLTFFFIGAVAGFAMAGAQSVSRTMVGLLSPPGRSAEFYGFFAVAGRSSSFIGPTVYGFLAAGTARMYEAQGQAVLLAEQSGQRLAIISIGVFILIGLVMLVFVDEKKGRLVSLRRPLRVRREGGLALDPLAQAAEAPADQL